MRALFVSKVPVHGRDTATDGCQQSLVEPRSVVQISEIRMVSSSPRYRSTASDTFLVLATQAIANVVKSSFGPSGLDKMMVDDIGVSSKQGSCEHSTLNNIRTSP